MGKVLGFTTDENLIGIQKKYAYTELNNKDYKGCINTCDFMLSLPAKDEKSRKELRTFCLRIQAACLKLLGRYEEALEKVKAAMKDCSKDDYYVAVFTRSLIYKMTGDKKKTLKDLNICIKWYRYNDMYYELAKALDVKADLLQSEKLFLESIENYKLAEQEKNYKDEEKFKIEFDNVYHRLIELYIHIGEQNMIKAYMALNNIHSVKAKEEASKKIKDLYRKEV